MRLSGRSLTGLQLFLQQQCWIRETRTDVPIMRQCLYSDFNQNSICSIEAGAWNIMLLIPYEEIPNRRSVVENTPIQEGSWESYCGRSPLRRKECARVCCVLLQGNLKFKGSRCKQVLVTISKRCFLGNHCSWCWACSNVHLSELWGTEAHRSEMELLLEVTFPVNAVSPPGGQQLEQISYWVFCAPISSLFLPRLKFLPTLSW